MPKSKPAHQCTTGVAAGLGQKQHKTDDLLPQKSLEGGVAEKTFPEETTWCRRAPTGLAQQTVQIVATHDLTLLVSRHLQPLVFIDGPAKHSRSKKPHAFKLLFGLFGVYE
jgi:hypothetical protein